MEVGDQALHALLCGMVGRIEGGKGSLGFLIQEVGLLGWGEVGHLLVFSTRIASRFCGKWVKMKWEAPLGFLIKDGGDWGGVKGDLP